MKREAMRHCLPPNKNILHIYELSCPPKKKCESNHALKYQFTGNRRNWETCQKITQKFNH